MVHTRRTEPIALAGFDARTLRALMAFVLSSFLGTFLSC